MNKSKEPSLPDLFWTSPLEWQAAHQTLDFLFASYRPQLGPVSESAWRIENGLNRLFPYFDRFCARICPDCTSPCCLGARVGYDFKDLLFMHALDLEPPPHQLRRREDEPCRYLGPRGCALPRILRPFICTWYYCGPMLELFRALPSRQQRCLSTIMTLVQSERRAMEEAFIRVQIKGPHL